MAATPSEWQFHRGDLRASGGLENVVMSGRLKVLWEAGYKSRPAGPLTLYNGALVCPSTKKRIVFFDKISGKYLGKIKTKTPAQTGVTMLDTLAFFSTSPSRNLLRCFNLRNRKEIWRRPVKDATGGTIIVDNRLIVGSTGGFLTALDPQTGRELWRFEADGRLTAPPSYGDGKIFQPADDGSLYALATTGEEIYRAALDEPLISGAVISDLVYVVSMTGKVFGLDPDNGEIVWMTPAGGRIWGAPALHGDRLFIALSSGVVMALDGGTGSILWRYDCGQAIKAPVTVIGRTVVAGTMAGRVLSLDGGDGRLIAEHAVEGAISTAAVTDGSRIYVVTDEGKIICFGDVHEELGHNHQRIDNRDKSQ